MFGERQQVCSAVAILADKHFLTAENASAADVMQLLVRADGTTFLKLTILVVRRGYG
jgi:hypothetical protein